MGDCRIVTMVGHTPSPDDGSAPIHQIVLLCKGNAQCRVAAIGSRHHRNRGIEVQETEPLAGTPERTGATLSLTVITCTADAWLLQRSAVLQVRVMVPQPSVTLLISVNVTLTVPSQLSVAVTIAGSGMLLHSTVALTGIPVKRGAVLSFTVKAF